MYLATNTQNSLPLDRPYKENMATSAIRGRIYWYHITALNQLNLLKTDCNRLIQQSYIQNPHCSCWNNNNSWMVYPQCRRCIADDISIYFEDLVSEGNMLINCLRFRMSFVQYIMICDEIDEVFYKMVHLLM